MLDIKQLCILEDATIREAIESIDHAGRQVAFVISSNGRLVAMVTDGDLRRGFLQGVSLEDPVNRIMQSDFISAPSRKDAARLMREKNVHHMPIIDADGFLFDVAFLDDFSTLQSRETEVILMAGGLGKRLRPLTETMPKPMLPVGGRPLLEIILRNFTDQGFRNFTICLNYMANVVRDYFGDGSAFDSSITYVQEEEALGTAGALTLLPERPSRPFIIMNGDLLTTLHFESVIRFHDEHLADATLCAREHLVQIPYGVVRSDDARLLSIEEKPTISQYVNAGIYVLSPNSLELLAYREHADMTQLFDRILERNMKAVVFPMREYWIDVGQIGDLQKARSDFRKE
ncbi:Nucleotidyl transferase [Fulvimarina pelagi HTCC2506]|uniref:Nucleotidyl transferase n=1 Tax=Fulvimarina pelagi HTCC2506 TaxID=314231 RepID=Q0G1T6_9HYPH|nr:nucleotidyltransferase family protein [Fulvimarina pelagi]EAU40995.1 Nucleotidyl transferase [Fulvimarina pelagi HTCC2506]